MTERLRWHDARQYVHNSVIYRISIWRGWLHTPSGEFRGVCTRCWKEERKLIWSDRRIIAIGALAAVVCALGLFEAIRYVR